eukprot:TRINITY_DN1059_c0_g1_i4.p1 TRINITY_DN1059_c0_g1~~TRINITY_DN1059_c0_g1_i4.p1  ORF type:complete len:856 (+),score=268.90 TRINITY_DN1059_c0_g1_i4:91-2658(+)
MTMRATLAVVMLLLAGGEAFFVPQVQPPAVTVANPVAHVATEQSSPSNAAPVTLLSGLTIPLDPKAFANFNPKALGIDADAIAQQVQSVGAVTGKMVTDGIDSAAPVIVSQAQALGDATSKFLQDGVQTDAVEKLKDAPTRAASRVQADIDGYWGRGRGKEILDLVNQKTADPTSAVVAPISDATNGFLGNIKGYWTKGRGKEILESASKVDVAEVATSTGSAVASAAGDAISKVVPADPTDLVPSEVKTAVAGTVSATSEATGKLLQYTGKNIAGTADSAAKAVAATASGLGQAVQGTVGGLSGVGSGLGAELGRAQESFAKVAAQAGDVKVQAFAESTGKAVADSLSAAVPVVTTQVQAFSDATSKAVTDGINAAVPVGKAIAESTSKAVADAVPVVTSQVQALSEATGKAVTEGINAAVPAVTSQAQALGEATSKFLQDGVQTEAVQQLKEAPARVSEKLLADSTSYWRFGRGKEILELLQSKKPDATAAVAPVKEATDGWLSNVKGYWSRGRGKEILETFSKVDVAEVASSTGSAVAGAAGDAISRIVPADPAEIVPPEVSSALKDTVTATTEATGKFLEYTGKNLGSSLAGTAGSAAKAASSTASGLSQAVQGTVSGLSGVGKGLSSEIGKAQDSIARVATQAGQIKVDPGQKLQAVTAALSDVKVDAARFSAPLGQAIQSIDQGLKETGAVLNRAGADWNRGNAIAADKIAAAAAAAAEAAAKSAQDVGAAVSETAKALQESKKAFEELGPALQSTANSLPKLDVQIDEEAAKKTAQELAENIGKATAEFIDAGTQKETLKQLDDAFKDYPSRVAQNLDKGGYWTTGRGKEILDQIGGLKSGVPFTSLK